MYMIYIIISEVWQQVRQYPEQHHVFVTAAAHRLSSSESHLTDAVSLLSSIPHPTTDSLPKFREVISLLSQTEHLQVRAFSFMSMINLRFVDIA